MQTVNSYLKNKKKKENTNRYKMKTVNEIAKANKIDLSNLEVKQDTSGLFQDSKGGFLKTVGGTLGDLASDIGEGFLRAVEGTTDWAQYRISDYEKWLSKQQKKAFDKLGMEKVGNKISGLSKTASEKLINNAKTDSTGALFGKNENQNLFKKGWTNKLEENSILGDTADTINQGIGQIGAMVGMSYLGGTVLGGTNAVSGTATALNRANKIRKTTSALTAYSSAYGNARSEAYKNGANDETANKTAMISGFSEAISEQFFDGIPGLKSQGWADNLTGKVAGSLEKSFGTKIGKTFMKVTDALGEGSEEIISNVLQATGNDIAHALDKNYNYGMENQTGNILKDSYNALTSEESLKSFFTAAMTSALVGGANTFLTTTQKNTIIKEYAKENDISFAEAKKQFETTINDETKAIAGNKSFNEKMDIQENIKRQELDNMKKGIFIEKGQRDQAFQYNETENEQVNNMLKSLSEKGNNTSENHATAKMAEKLIKDLGLNIEFTNSEELRAKGLPEADGYKEGNKLVLNLNSDKLTSYVMGHETTHFLENQGELYDAVSKAVFDLATTKGIHDGEVAKIKKLYANIIDNKVNEEMQNKGRALTEQEINKITDDIVRSELTANYVGEFFTDEEFFRTLGKENPSILQKLAEFFDELLSKITGNTERQQIHEAKRKIKKVYAEYMNGSQINLENSQEVQMQNKGITEQKQQDSINIPTKQETTQKQKINKSSEVNLPTAEKIENKNKENAQKNENTVKKIEKTDNETKTTEENIPTKTKIDNEEGIKKIKEKYDTTEKVTGSKKTIVLSNGEKLSGTYKLIEAGNVSASHNAETFEKTEGFPTTENGTTVNDRDYQSDKNAQNLVTQKSDNFDGRAFADNGVIVTKDGIVVSGNDRTMSGDLAAKKGTDTAYIEYLKDNASQFGFTLEQIDNMKHPRVVFELNKKLPYDTKTFAMFNKDAKKSKSVSERAKEIGKTIDEDTINSVSEIIDNFDTIDDLYNNEKATRELISLMQAKNIIDSNDLSDVYNGSKFTGSGKDLVESVILGSVINEDNAKYFSNNNDLKFKVMKAAPALIQNKTLNDYSINELFNNAVEVYKKASSSKMTLDEFTSQSNIFGDNDVDLVTKRIAQLLETKGYKNLRNFIEKYNAMAEFPASGQTDIFSGGQVETKEDILRKALNIDDNTEIQYLISDRQYNINDFARRFAKANNYKNEISMDFISKVANAYAYGEYDPNYNYTNVDDKEDSKFANDLIEKIKFELDKKGYHLNELEDRFVKNNKQYMLSDDDLNKYIFDKDFYNQFQYENKEKITKSVEELQAELETIDESNDDGWEKGYNIRQDIKALKNGYDNQYDYIVSREKERLTEQYQRGQLDKKIQEKKNEEIKLKQLEEDIKNSSDFKNKQFEIIQKTNPAPDENHVWIRSPKDIKTWSEAMQDEESFAWGDFNYEDAEKALKTNRITVYSSYNIKNGTFVSTSYQQALDYAGGDRSKVHSKVVKTTNVAWINGDEGQYAKVDNQYMLKGDEMTGIYTPKNQFTNRLSDGLIQENLPTEEKTNLPTSNTNNEEENMFEKPTRRQVIDRNRQLAREQLGDITKIKDKKKGIMYQINTMKRNLRDIMSPEQAKSMYETYFRPISENNAKMEKDITSYNERIQKYNLNNEESVYTQMLGELRYNPDSELTSKEVNDYYNKNSRKIDADKVDKAIEEFRSIYDELIGRVNQTLTANGYKEIEYRQGYFPHFIEEKATSPIGKFAEKLGWKVKSGQLPTDIAGITDQFKPGKTWTTFSQHRTGDATDYNALKGLDNYLRGAMDVIHHTNDIQKLRALENEIRYQYSEKGIKEKIDSIYADDTLDMEEKNDAIYTLTNNMRNSGLGNFATEIRNYTDNLANKKAFGDRSMEQQFGRDTYSIMQNINSRVSANMVGGNISSALTNFIPITQAWSQLSTKNLMKGMYESIKASIKDDGFANNSIYLTNRTKKAERLYKSGLDKINDKLGIPFEAIDSFTSNTIVRAKYHDNIEKGMSEQEAIRNADEFAKDVMAGRSKGDMPTIMNQKNPLMKLMTAFQLEVNNQYGYMFKDIPADLGDEAKRKLVGAFIKMFFGAWLYNQLSEKITGRKSAFSPIDMAIDDIKTATNENLDLGDKISAIAKDTAQELPFVGGLLGGGRLPIQSAIPYENPLEMVTGTISDVSKTFDEDESKKKNAIKKLMKEWSKPVYYVAMPFGGGQIKKTIEGLGMYDDNLPIAGSYTDSGKLRFEAPDDTLGKLQAAVFGQYASKNAREYFDNGYQPLTEKQINTALDAGLNINEYREYNSGIKAQENNNDKINYINNLPLEIEQKNVLANDVLKRKDKVDISDYGNYGSLEEFDYANKNPGKYNAITQITDYDSYNEYKKKINEIKDQYEDTNERKQAVFSYINSLELNKYQKLMLQKLASGYSIKNYKREMQDYINGLELSAAEKQQIDDALFK